MKRPNERWGMSNSRNGNVVRAFEEQFAKYVGAQYGIALCNGTATLHAALVALGVQPGDRVAVPPLTMASTTLGVLHTGATPIYEDVDPRWWGMVSRFSGIRIPVSIYGLWSGFDGARVLDDAAETLNPHQDAAFTSYSFQASKILSAGEGGMLVTNDSHLAERARQFSRLGYPNGKVADLKRPDAIRHEVLGYNYRMNDLTAGRLLWKMQHVEDLLALRKYAAGCYRQAIQGVGWITPQYVPEGWPHSYWAWTVALDRADMWEPFVAALERVGHERPYAAWRITYREPAFRHLAVEGTCPIAEDLQPRLVQFQTNRDKLGAEKAAEQLRRTIQLCGW